MKFKDYVIQKYSEEENIEFKNINDLYEYFNIKDSNVSNSNFNFFQFLKAKVFSLFSKKGD